MSIFGNYHYNLFNSCFAITSIRWVCIYDDAGCLLWSAVQWVEGSDWATPLTPVERQLVLTTKFWVCWNDATSARNRKSISVSRPKCVGSDRCCDFESDTLYLCTKCRVDWVSVAVRRSSAFTIVVDVATISRKETTLEGIFIQLIVVLLVENYTSLDL